MNPDHLKLAHTFTEKLMRGDETIVDLLQEDFVWTMAGDCSTTLPWIGGKRGKQAVLDFIRDYPEYFKNHRFVLHDTLHGPERVAFFGSLSSEYIGSSDMIDIDFISTFTFRDEKILSHRLFESSHAVSQTTYDRHALQKKARRYYEKINAGEFDDEYFNLFAEDVELFYPKFGVAYGHEAIAELGRRVQSAVSRFGFDLEKFTYTTERHRIAVEIVEHGTTVSGKHFPDGKVSFGKFCNVFEFNTQGKIQRYHCYGDPDYAGEDAQRTAIFAQTPDGSRQTAASTSMAK